MIPSRTLEPQPGAQCDLRPELAACFAIGRRPPPAAPAAEPVRGILAELARYGRP